MMTERGVKHPLSWLRKLGISPYRCQKLMQGEPIQLKLQQLTLLCRFLRCTPNDLLCWQQEEEALPQQHPLLQLLPRDSKPPVAERLKRLSPAQLQQIGQWLDDMGAE